MPGMIFSAHYSLHHLFVHKEKQVVQGMIWICHPFDLLGTTLRKPWSWI